MLEGIREEQIIVGAYAREGGICPMLAAHRRGGRTNLISFARAWDGFAFTGARVIRPRPATARELLVLRTHLEASLLEEELPEGDLAAAIAEHDELVRRHRRGEPPAVHHEPRSPHREATPQRSTDRDRSQELQDRPGWSWLRPVRRYDDYRWALGQVQAVAEREELAAPACQS
jgi:hypothetical protein